MPDKQSSSPNDPQIDSTNEPTFKIPKAFIQAICVPGASSSPPRKNFDLAEWIIGETEGPSKLMIHLVRHSIEADPEFKELMQAGDQTDLALDVMEWTVQTMCNMMDIPCRWESMVLPLLPVDDA